MKNLAALIIVICFIFGCHPKPERDLKWKEKDEYHYWLEYSEIDVQSDSIVNVKKIKSQVKFRINKIFADSSLLTWTNQSLKIIPDSLRTNIQRLSNDSLSVEYEISIRYSVDNSGNILNILNWDSLKSLLIHRWDEEFKESMSDSPLSKSKIDSIRSIFTSDKYLKNKLIYPLSLFHQIYSVDILNQPNSTIIDCGDCGSKKIKVELIDNYDNQKLIRFSNQLDNEISTEFAMEVFPSIDKQELIANLTSIIDTNLYLYNLATDIPYHIESWRMIHFENRLRQNSYSIKRK